MTIQAQAPSTREFFKAILRKLVIAASLVLLLASAWQNPPPLAWTWVMPVIILFVAVQVNYPFYLLDKEVYLVQVLTVGAGLLFGATLAGWSAALGMLLGFFFRRRSHVRPFYRPDSSPETWVDSGYIAGRHTLALLGALYLSGYASGLVFQPQGFQRGLGLATPLLLYAVFHGGLFLIESHLSTRKPAAAWLQNDLVLLGLVELLPLSFVLITVLSYPSIGISTLLALGSVPVLIAVLLSGITTARLNLDRRLQELDTLNQVSEALRVTLDLPTLLGDIHRQVSRLLEVDNFYVALYDADTQRIWYPLAVKQGQRETWPSRGLADRLTDRVIRERRPVLINPRRSREATQMVLPPSNVTPTAWIGVPLIASDRVIGCLALFSVSPSTHFSRGDLDLLTILSGQISVAIENALLFEQTQRRTAQLETLNRLTTLISASLDPQEVLAQICTSVTQVGGGDHSAIFLIDPDQNQIWLAYANQLSAHFVEVNQAFSIADNARTRCLRTGKPHLVPSIVQSTLERDWASTLQVEGIQALGDFPLVTPEGQIGFLSVYFDQPHDFYEEEADLLQTFASQAALAVSNARMHARTDLALSQRANQLSILESVGRELAAAMNSDRLFDMILTYAREFSDSPWGSIGLYNATARVVEIKAYSGYRGKMRNYSINRGITGRSLRTRQLCNIPDVRIDPDYIDLVDGAARSQLSVPLLHEGRVLGVLTLESAQPNAYSNGDVTFIKQLVDQAAIAVVNAELYSETQRRLREQSTLYLVSTHLAGKLELEGVVLTVRRAMVAAVENVKIGIYLWEESERQYLLQLPDLSEPDHPTGDHFPASVTEQALESLLTALRRPEPIQISRPGEIPPAFAMDCKDCQMLILPLSTGQHHLGMVVLHLPSSQALKDDELQLLRAIAAQATISLQNALLFADVTHGRDRLAAILDSVREGMLMVGPTGRIMLANESMKEIAGVSPADLIGRRLTDLNAQTLRFCGYTPEDIQRITEALSRGQVPNDPKTTFKISDSMPERVLERASLPVWGSQGRAIGWMLVLRDVTEEYEIAQARELITETLVHDLRSPLSAVLGALDVMEENAVQESRPDALNPQALQVARRGARRVLSMVESLLDISRMQSGSMELNLAEANLRDMVAAMIGEYIAQANEYGIIVRNNVPMDLPKLYVDVSKISRVIMNLLDNALKFSPSGGQVTFSALANGEDWVTVRVSDTGPGIPEEFREKIFQRFTQVPGQRGRRRGSGLGLTFCRLALEAHGGRIWVEQRPLGGSTFIFTLPLVKSQEPA